MYVGVHACLRACMPVRRLKADIHYEINHFRCRPSVHLSEWLQTGQRFWR